MFNVSRLFSVRIQEGMHRADNRTGVGNIWGIWTACVSRQQNWTKIGDLRLKDRRNKASQGQCYCHWKSGKKMWYWHCARLSLSHRIKTLLQSLFKPADSTLVLLFLQRPFPPSLLQTKSENYKDTVAIVYIIRRKQCSAIHELLLESLE